ncbi:MAG: prepilin-type N-terminal cleavage/methylation domain-containing protein [Actinomycetota bacterium]
MFQRFHEKLQEREGGFTLIELLVVILIIAILAAIAIPVFLNQREKGWVAQAESALKNAATAQESYLTANDDYAIQAELGSLETDEGLKYAGDVTLTIVSPAASGDATAYCMEATHAKLTALTDVWHYDSNAGAPEDGGC